MSDTLTELRRPFTPAAVKWKIQTNPKHDRAPAIIVGFIDSRLVAERLNHVVGLSWSDQYGQVSHSQGSALVTCALTVEDATRVDVGWSNGVGTDMASKTVYSDAFKRAGVKFGIGAFLYALPEIKLWPNELDSYKSGQDTKYRLTEANRFNLTDRFTKWVGRQEIKDRFGDPIDHGDAA